MHTENISIDKLTTNLSHEAIAQRIRSTPFVMSYVVAALSTPSEDDLQEWQDKLKYGGIVEEIASASLIAAYHTCEQFIANNRAALEAALELYPGSTDGSSTIELMGHDLLLSRNGEGSGYFDRGLGAIGAQLQDAARAMGSTELVLGEDNQLHFEGGQRIVNAFNWQKGDTDLSVFFDTDVHVKADDLPDTLQRVDSQEDIDVTAITLGLEHLGKNWTALLAANKDGEFTYVFATESAHYYAANAEFLPICIDRTITSNCLHQEAELRAAEEIPAESNGQTSGQT